METNKVLKRFNILFNEHERKSFLATLLLLFVLQMINQDYKNYFSFLRNIINLVLVSNVIYFILKFLFQTSTITNQDHQDLLLDVNYNKLLLSKKHLSKSNIASPRSNVTSPTSPSLKSTTSLTASPLHSLINGSSPNHTIPIYQTPSKNAKLIFSRASPISPQLRDVALINRYRNRIPSIYNSLCLLSRLNSKLSLESSSNSESILSSSFSSSISLPGTFQNALKPVQSPVRKEIIEDGLIFKNANQTLNMWHVSQHIDLWSENVKKWLAKHVFQALISRIDKVDEELKRIGWAHLCCDVSTYVDSLNSSMILLN